VIEEKPELKAALDAKKYEILERKSKGKEWLEWMAKLVKEKWELNKEIESKKQGVYYRLEVGKSDNWHEYGNYLYIQIGRFNDSGRFLFLLVFKLLFWLIILLLMSS